MVSFGLFSRAARVAFVRLTCVGLDNRTVQTNCLFCIKRINIRAAGVRHQFHVGCFDRLPARDGRTVKHKAFFQKVFVDLIGHNSHVLKLAARISKADVDVFGTFFFDQLKNCVLAHFLFSSAWKF